MADRCRWCGRFVAQGTAPITGLNYWGDPVTQTLCPQDGPQWIEMAALNVLRYRKFGDTYYPEEGNV